MKKLILSIFTISLIFVLPLCTQEEQEVVREEVRVANVEVPVRVFYKKEPVDNLTRENFKLYEGKKEQVITSFRVVRNKIKLPHPGQGTSAAPAPGRYFVLVFRVTRYHEQFREGVKYVFDNVLTENDRLRVFANNKSIFINRIGDKAKSLARVNDLVREQAQFSRMQLLSYTQRIEKEIREARFKMLGGGRQPVVDFILDFLTNFLRTWKDYKRKYIMLDKDKFYYFAKHLEGIKLEKWVLNFYQVDMFPKISMAGEMRREINRILGTLQASLIPDEVARGRIMHRLLLEIDNEMSAGIEFPAEEVSKLFYKVDAVFHSIFMRSMLETVSQDLEYQRLATDFENCLREITRATGGTLATTNNIKAAADKLGEKENVYYLLTYAPTDPDKIGKIKVQVSGHKKYEVRYDDKMRADYIKDYLAKMEERNKTPTILITNLTFDKKELQIGVGGFMVKNTGEGPEGQVGIHVTIKDDRGVSVYDKSNPLTTKQGTISISIPFKLPAGRYNIMVDVKDFLTGKTSDKFIQAKI